MSTKRWFVVLITLFLSAFSVLSSAQTCANRGDLEEAYCDANRDLLADAPATKRNPARIVVGISSTEDSQTAFKTFSPLIDHLKTCLKKDVILHSSVGEANVLEALRNGAIHIAQFATGGTMYAVNFAGAIPFAGKGLSSVGKRDTYTLMLIVRADSGYRTIVDLKDKTVAHTSLTSNSGNLAPRALFPEQGLTPDKDYKVVYSGKHDNSITGVARGLYDGAAIASDVFDRLIAKGEVKRNQFRVLYESEEFPPDAFALAHDLDTKLASNIRNCFLNFKMPAIMSKQLEGNDRFFPVTYSHDWRVVRLIARAAGTKMTKEAYQEVIKKK